MDTQITKQTNSVCTSKNTVTKMLVQGLIVETHLSSYHICAVVHSLTGGRPDKAAVAANPLANFIPP